MKKKLTAIMLTGAMCASLLSGCGGINKNETAATIDGVKVSMGLTNFYCRYQQASMEDLYKVYFGDNVWVQDLYGSGTTLQESLKDSVMSALHDLYTLQLHKEEYGVELSEEEKKTIGETADAFISGNSSEALKEMGATKSIVEEFLTLYTLQDKMQKVIEEKADTNVSDEEANMRGYTQIRMATDSHTDEEGNTVAYTEDEKNDLKLIAEEMVVSMAEEGATLESVAQANGYEPSKETYATYKAEDDDSEDTPVIAALKGLKTGEISAVIEDGNALYIVRVDSETDSEATEKNRESIIEQRKSDYYNEVMEGWQAEDDWEVNEEALAKIQFENSLTTKAP